MKIVKRILAAMLAAVIVSGMFAPLATEAATQKIAGGLHFAGWASTTSCYLSVREQNISAFEYRVYHNSLKFKSSGTSYVYTDGSNEICKIDDLTYRACNFVSVRAKKNGSWTAWSPKYPIVPRIEGFTSKITKQPNTVTLTWKKITGVNYYEVYLSTTGTGNWVKIGSPTGTRITFNKAGGRSLKTYKTYYVKIVACKKFGKNQMQRSSGNSTKNYNGSFYIRTVYY